MDREERFSLAWSKINGIRAFHIANGEEWFESQTLKQVLEGVKKERPREKKTVRPPVTLRRLQILVEGLDANNGKDNCVAAMATMAFYGQCRLGELMPDSPNREKFEEQNFPKSLHLPWTKTKKEEGEDVTICAQRGTTDPIAALNHHTMMNDVEGGEMLASFIDERGQRKVLTKRAFLLRCNEIWLKEGLSRLTGHSFRIGGTTYFLLKGKDPNVVKALGRWSSDAFLRYWRQLDQLGSCISK
ncbi:hypothetical protein BDZ89DRAFT_1159244 [Hymenopellis radicata]|nr:hypothetical protein BDZ89DRAFT_1159244 [Hymenopellis radicata]